MLYCRLFRRIHWAAAITSLVRAMPWSSITSSETIPAVGAAPACSAALPAARPATKVPWPRPSPREFPGREVMFTCARTRPAKSPLPASIPESTNAIEGAPVAGEPADAVVGGQEGPQRVDADGRGPELVGAEPLPAVELRKLVVLLRVPAAERVERNRRVRDDHAGPSRRRGAAGREPARTLLRRRRCRAACCRRRPRPARAAPARLRGRCARSRGRPRSGSSEPVPGAPVRGSRPAGSCRPRRSLRAERPGATTIRASSPCFSETFRPSERRPPRPVPHSPLVRVWPPSTLSFPLIL